MTTNIIKDYYDRITVIVSRHYYRCNKFYCLIALIVCRGESERERVQPTQDQNRTRNYNTTAE